MMMKKLCLVFISILQLCDVSAGAQTNDKVKEMAMKIADRILTSTTYEFVDKKSGKTYTSLKNMPLNKAVKVRSKYLDWHYTNGVTNIALMELGNKLDMYLANLHTSFLCNLIYPTFTTLLVYIN
mgnify:FL=1|jgi:hypothetical protein